MRAIIARIKLPQVPAALRKIYRLSEQPGSCRVRLGSVQISHWQNSGCSICPLPSASMICERSHQTYRPHHAQGDLRTSNANLSVSSAVRAYIDESARMYSR